MRLLSDNELVWSPVVANSRMNRSRKASGINSYEKEFKFKPELFLEACIRKYGQVSWLDLCCGEGNALIQAATYLFDLGIHERATLKGVDLVDAFQPIGTPHGCIGFEALSIVDWVPSQPYDLITCSHGLHYVGDKLKVVETAIGALGSQGLFIANLDIDSIVIEGVTSKTWLRDFLKNAGIDYNGRTKIIRCSSPLEIDFNLIYKGADDLAGPNYTGQEAVTSFYSKV